MQLLALSLSFALVIGPLAIVQDPLVAEAPAVDETPADEPVPAACATDSECPGDRICEASTCVDPAAAVAGCRSDVECKGERICVEGSCQAPPAPVVHPAPAAPVESNPPLEPARPQQPADNGWALAGGITGISLTVPALLMAIASDFTREEQIPSLPIGVGATVLIAAAGPIAFGGAQSARRGANVRGGSGLLITGWVFYGLALSNAIGLIAMGVSEVEPPPGVISLTGVLGLTSGVLMSVGAFVAHKQATQKMRDQSARSLQPKSPQLSLGVAPLRQGDRPVGATVGLAGRF